MNYSNNQLDQGMYFGQSSNHHNVLRQQHYPDVVQQQQQIMNQSNNQMHQQMHFGQGSNNLYVVQQQQQPQQLQKPRRPDVVQQQLFETIQGFSISWPAGMLSTSQVKSFLKTNTSTRDQDVGYPLFRAGSSASSTITSRLLKFQGRSPTRNIEVTSRGHGFPSSFATSQLPILQSTSRQNVGSVPNLSKGTNSGSQTMIPSQFPDIQLVKQKLEEEPLYKRQRSRVSGTQPSFSEESSTSVSMENRRQVPVNIQPGRITEFLEVAAIGMCTQRINDYTLKILERPKDNNMEFWKDLISEFYSADAKTRFCFSSYHNKSTGTYGGQQATWKCDLCLVQPGHGRGFEISAENLPRMCKRMYDNGTIQEQYQMDRPIAYKSASNLYVLHCAKVIHEGFFPDRRVVREGQLCAVFTSDFKIWRWNFCGKHHYEFDLSGNLITQVPDGSEATKNSMSFQVPDGSKATENSMFFLLPDGSEATKNSIPFQVPYGPQATDNSMFFHLTDGSEETKNPMSFQVPDASEARKNSMFQLPDGSEATKNSIPFQVPYGPTATENSMFFQLTDGSEATKSPISFLVPDGSEATKNSMSFQGPDDFETTKNYFESYKSYFPASQQEEISRRAQNSGNISSAVGNVYMNVMPHQIPDTVKQSSSTPSEAMVRYSTNFSGLNVYRDQELQPIANNVTIRDATTQTYESLHNSSNQMNDTYVSGQRLPFANPSNLSSSSVKDMSVLQPQGSGVSSFASFAARICIDSTNDISNDVNELDSPTTVASMFENQNANVDVNTGGYANADYQTVSGAGNGDKEKEVAATLDNQGDDFVRQLYLFVGGETVWKFADF